MQSNVKINILNFKEKECVSYSLILLKGTVNPRENNYFEDKDEVECVSNASRNFWPVLNRRFKCLVQLEHGPNDITIRYKGREKSLTVEYVRRDCDYHVVPIYFIYKGHSGDFWCSEEGDHSTESACRKLGFCAGLVQSLYAEKLFEQGFGRKTFLLERDVNPSAPSCRVFESERTVEEARRLSDDALWEVLAREVVASPLGGECFKFLGVTSSTVAAAGGRQVLGDVALGCGGLALVGSLALCTWPETIEQVVPCLSDPTPLHPPLKYNLWYRGTRGGCCSASIGSLCHELGHTFDLGHPAQGIMSTDFHLFHSVFLPLPVPERPTSTPCYRLQFVPDLIVYEGEGEGRGAHLRPPPEESPGPPPPSPPPFHPFPADMPSFSPGCAVILSLHKWFNGPSLQHPIDFDSNRSVLKSEGGLRVVQVRGVNGRVVRSWELRGEHTPHMVLPRQPPGLTIFAIDKVGNSARFFT